MSDVFLFLIGTLVTLIVSAAVALLMWGAAREPRAGEARPLPRVRSSWAARPSRSRMTAVPVRASGRGESWKRSS